MPPLGMAASLGLGAPRAATSSGSVPAGADYDEDAQTYFTALEAATGWVEPADYDDKKTAISDYYTNLKADSNFTDIKALYLPIWRVAGPNAINAVNPGTYNLTFAGTVTHNGGDYIYGDGSTGYATTGFHGPASSNAKFFGINDTSAGVNVLDLNSDANSKMEYGWYGFFGFSSKWSTGNVGWYWWTTTFNGTTVSDSTGLFTSNSTTPGAGKTNTAKLYQDGTELIDYTAGTGTGSNAGADAQPLSLMGRMYFTGTVYNMSKKKCNFWTFGNKLTSISDFNTDTATMLAAI
jgi:hypothetical protein